ncbi:MAG: AraC family transcriptional regulator [Spirochaetaceae bacterium]|jgi:AraC-like DNA-binding protein|nr:AraC family transcriptional regulator [Spirochaetaceae bacterium]
MTGKYVFVNPAIEEAGGNDIAEGFKKITSTDMSDEESFSPPKTTGEGKCARLASGYSYDIFRYDMQLKNNVVLSAETEGPLYLLQFCMESGMDWQETESRLRMRLQTNQGAFSFITKTIETCEYQAGRSYKAFRINFAKSRIEKITEEFGFAINGFSQKNSNFCMSYFETTPECRFIIEQITRCHYSGAIKMLYLDSKINELLAHSLELLQNKIIDKAPRISRTDVEKLLRAKEILDRDITTRITIPQLTRMVYLNEYKLKNGFKHIFGKPVYRYLLDNRMEQARMLLERKTFHIEEIAERVGYSDRSSFSKAFFKRYGYWPGEYIR